MVAMDFFAALNCYDFLNQYCSNLLKNPTVRGLKSTEARDELSSTCIPIVMSRCLSAPGCYIPTSMPPEPSSILYYLKLS